MLKRSVKERKSKNSMLVNPPPHLSHVLSSMHREWYILKTNEKGKKLPHGGDSGGGLIGARVATQSR